jgi:hypothetical protein
MPAAISWMFVPVAEFVIMSGTPLENCKEV